MAQKLDLKQAKKAIDALYKYREQNVSSNNLLESDEENGIYVEISTHKIMNKSQIKRKKIPLPHSPYPEDIEICYITKDDEKSIEEKVKSGNVTSIKKVVNTRTLGTVYKAYEAKRKLLASYDLFMVDDRISHMVLNLIGSKFVQRNKVPIAIKGNGSLKHQVEKALQATYVKLHNGLITRVLIGNFGMSKEEVLKNYEVAVPEIVKIAAHEWDQVEMISVHGLNSPLLPIYTALPKQENEENKKEKKNNKKIEPKKEEQPKKEEEEKKETKKNEKKDIKVDKKKVKKAIAKSKKL
ncbi:ribosomal protein L1p/L10e family-domain-containing protein [Cokeromyces recurvatus]|uniref:ribosomal protein L1p/L10e family-domain-containing protein n=1 Tax=Cokeromyces recurvatus TaxID=90255 RepID=UPI00221EB07F|nr:ribosomal protein L1p/L10e family-domain-containing protein [Cokeromyces recurvatus]KAI7897735.1 ribosomal protein L1p/L10e family-domain-containing protein [Cokeromyces recurvatus]